MGQNSKPEIIHLISVDRHTLYQFLISELRYGYTRNNHLMPGGAYDHVKEYLPKIAEQDKEYAIYVAKQLCEEAISLELSQFEDGEDDEFGNRKEVLKFIDWCFNYVNAVEDWSPYNYNQFIKNCKKDTEPRYNVYEIINGEKKLLTTEPISNDSYIDFILNSVKLKEITFNKETIKVTGDFNDRRRHYIYHLIEPVQKDFYLEHI